MKHYKVTVEKKIKHCSMFLITFLFVFVDTREHCDVSLSCEPFNSRHIPGLSQVNIDCTFIIVLIVESIPYKKEMFISHFFSIYSHFPEVKLSQTIFKSSLLGNVLKWLFYSPLIYNLFRKWH